MAHRDKIYMRTRGAGDGDLTAGLLGMMNGGDVLEAGYGREQYAKDGKEMYKKGGSKKKMKKKSKKY